MDGLIVLEPFASMIINGEKKWELRSREPPSSKLDKELYLLSQGHSLGTIKIVEAKGPLPKKELARKFTLHKSNLTGLDEFFESYVWEVNVCKKFSQRKKYVHPNGAQVWVKDVTLEKNKLKQKISSYF